ncbi:MAG: hypothetical protein HY649_02000 [Acidobacteria bacterium]|nr:hypothetical protein [Acidobacteriota bacterium]
MSKKRYRVANRRKSNQFRITVLCWSLLTVTLTVAGVSAWGQDQTPTTVAGQPAPLLTQRPASSDRLFVEMRAFSNLSRITGPARDNSFLTDGNNSAIDFSYLQDFTFGTRQVEAVSVLRYSDDRRVDPERNSLQRAYLRISGPRSEYNFGDYLVNYSRFSFNQNLKGLHFIRRAAWGHGFRLLGNVGTFTDRYGSLFKGWREDVAAKGGILDVGDLPGKPYTRLVSGLRAEQKVDVDKTLGFNWSYGNDIVRSIPIDPLIGREPLIPLANQVLSLDARMLIARVWDLQAEAAYSITTSDTRFSSSRRKDYALRFDNSIRSGPWNLGLYYSRMMPSFSAINARQVADLQDALVRVGVQLSSPTQVLFTYRRTNDNLRDQNPNPETVFQLPEIRFSFRDLPGLGGSLLDVGYRERRQEQSGLADRVTRTPFFEIGIPISSSILSIAYEHRSLIDRLNRANQTAADNVSVSFRSIFNAGDWMFVPLLRYEHNREIFDRVNTTNNNRNIQAALTLDAPRYFSFEVLFRQVGATLFQDAPVLAPTTGQTGCVRDGSQVFALTCPAGFRRPAFRAAVTYKLFNDENRFFTLSYERNNNVFAFSRQDFLERVIQLAVVWRFQRQ